MCLLISIHAPAKGATASRMDCALRGCYFNPRSREGSDSSRGLYMFTFCVFQSTLPRRERQYRTFCNSFLHHFNPRSREGSDLVKPGRYLITFSDFNPRSREGSDADRDGNIYNLQISIHAPAKGATAFINIFSLAVRLFFISSHQ